MSTPSSPSSPLCLISVQKMKKGEGETHRGCAGEAKATIEKNLPVWMSQSGSLALPPAHKCAFQGGKPPTYIIYSWHRLAGAYGRRSSRSYHKISSPLSHLSATCKQSINQQLRHSYLDIITHTQRHLSPRDGHSSGRGEDLHAFGDRARH